MSEAMSERELEEIEEKRFLARGAPLAAEAIVAMGELMEEDIPNLLHQVRRSHTEAAKQDKEIEFLRQQLSITTAERDQWDGNYCDLRLEMDKLKTEAAELRERVQKQEGYLRAKDQTIDSMGKANGRMDDTIFELRERVESLEGILREYGRHTNKCRIYAIALREPTAKDCTCGFVTALSQANAQAKLED